MLRLGNNKATAEESPATHRTDKAVDKKWVVVAAERLDRRAEDVVMAGAEAEALVEVAHVGRVRVHKSSAAHRIKDCRE